MEQDKLVGDTTLALYYLYLEIPWSLIRQLANREDGIRLELIEAQGPSPQARTSRIANRGEYSRRARNSGERLKPPRQSQAKGFKVRFLSGPEEKESLAPLFLAIGIKP
jgi:hypothetical protein